MGAVAGGSAAEAVPLHGASEAFAPADGGHVDQLALL